MVKVKKYSLIELVVSIIIIPIIISIITSLYFNNSKVSNFSILNSKNYADISQTIDQLDIDSNTTYKVEIEDKKIIIHNINGIVEYSLKEDGLYRNNIKYANVDDISIINLTNQDSIYSLYEITMYSKIRFDEETKPIEIKTKIVFPIEKN